MYFKTCIVFRYVYYLKHTYEIILFIFQPTTIIAGIMHSLENLFFSIRSRNMLTPPPMLQLPPMLVYLNYHHF